MKRRERRAPANPKGIVSISPRLARQRLPWVIVEQISQPQRGCGNSVFVRRAWDVGRNPVGVVIFFGHFPRVARASQPWALGRNPVGILGWRDAAVEREAWLRRVEVLRDASRQLRTFNRA